MPKEKKHNLIGTYHCPNQITLKDRLQESRDEIREEIEELIRLKPNDEVLLVDRYDCDEPTLLHFKSFTRGFYKFSLDGEEEIINNRSKTFLDLLKGYDDIVKVQASGKMIPIKLLHTGESVVQYEGRRPKAADLKKALEGWEFIDTYQDGSFGVIKPKKFAFSWSVVLEMAKDKITASFEPDPPKDNFEMVFYPDLEDKPGTIMSDYMDACERKDSAFELKFNAVWRWKQK